MPHRTLQVLNNLQERTGAESMTEIFRRALALLDVVTAKQEEGGRLYVHWPDGSQSEIHIL
jgi:hypothetical protein